MSSYAYIKHQTEIFIFDDELSEWFNPDEDIYDLVTYKLDIRKKEDFLEFAILGMYWISQKTDNKEEKVYILNAGRVFEIAMYDPNDNDSNKIFEEAFLIVYRNLKTLAENKVRLNSKEFIFPEPYISYFHEHLNLVLARIF